MKFSKFFLTFCSLFLVANSSSFAATINGGISLSGGFVPAGGTALGDTTGIDFLEWNGTSYVSGTSGGSFTTSSVSGDIADFVTPSPFILGNINDFSFDPFSGSSTLWEIGGFSFDITSVNIEFQSDTTLVLSGFGDLYGNGFETTLSDYIFTGNSLGSTFSWSLALDTNVDIVGVPTSTVPLPPAILLFMSGLFGLGAIRKFKK